MATPHRIQHRITCGQANHPHRYTSEVPRAHWQMVTKETSLQVVECVDQAPHPPAHDPEVGCRQSLSRLVGGAAGMGVHGLGVPVMGTAVQVSGEQRRQLGGVRGPTVRGRVDGDGDEIGTFAVQPRDRRILVRQLGCWSAGLSHPRSPQPLVGCEPGPWHAMWRTGSSPAGGVSAACRALAGSWSWAMFVAYTRTRSWN